MNIKELNKKIGAFLGGQKKRKETIQNLGIDCLVVIQEHGNTEPLAKLIQGLHDAGSRDSKAVQEWAYHFASLRSKKTDDGSLVIKSTNKTKELDIEAAKDTPWYAFKPQPKPSEFKPESRFSGLIRDMMAKEKGNMSPEQVRAFIVEHLTDELDKYNEPSF